MIRSITIKNFALIENAEIILQPGLNILSGETGAGKSIILEAISLLLGGRAPSEVIRHGADEAQVEGYFEVGDLTWMPQRLADLGLEMSGDELLIKRTLHRSGKNRIFINGQTATLSMLQNLTEGLVDLCGQHEHQSLFKIATQLDLIDRFGELIQKVTVVRAQLATYRELQSEWDQLRKKEEERIQRLDFIRFQLDELKSANLVSNEDEQLSEEKKQLQTHGQRIGISQQIETALSEDGGAIDQIKVALAKARALAQIDAVGEVLQTTLTRAFAEVEEASRWVRAYSNNAEFSEARFDEVQERLSLITQLKRKYGSTIEEILVQAQKLAAEMNLLENLSTRLEGLEAEVERQGEQTKQAADRLFQDRKKAALLFSKAVSRELKELRMQDSEIAVQLGWNPKILEWGPLTLGTVVEFLVKTNAGEEAKPIQKVVSGGELSRILLAIRQVIADRGGIGVYLFDEIDAGLGGQTAFTVGKKLKSVSRFNQVVCITHVPQVAAFADHHLSISKSTVKGRTLTQVHDLKMAERREEIARMLGSEKITPSALKNAKDLMASAGAG